MPQVHERGVPTKLWRVLPTRFVGSPHHDRVILRRLQELDVHSSSAMKTTSRLLFITQRMHNTACLDKSR